MLTEQEKQAHAEALAKARADALTEGEGKADAKAKERSDAERARVQGILDHAEAEGRNALARHLAFNTTMSVEDAGKALAASDKVAPKTGLLAPAMATQKPGPQPDAPAPERKAEAPKINAAEIYRKRAEAAEHARMNQRPPA